MENNQTKKCSNCNIHKTLNYFGVHKKGLYGLRSECKDCINKYSQLYKKTKKGVSTKIYSHQKESSRKRLLPPPLYSKEEFEIWLFSKPLFHVLYDEWLSNNYIKKLKPSVDRKDDSLPYSFDNIQLMSWGDNDSKNHMARKQGYPKHGGSPHTPVSQFTKHGVFIANFISLHEAGRKLCINHTHIWSCCNNKYGYKTAGGFIWKYTER